MHSGSRFAALHLREDAGSGPTLDDEAAVKKEMTDEFVRILSQGHGAYSGLDVNHVVYSSVMAWDHARPSQESELPATHLFDDERQAGVCGDFFSGRKAAGADAGATGVEAAAIR